MRPLEEGDIVNLDVTVYAHYKGVGYHGDLNETYFVGKCDKDSHHLVKVAFDALVRSHLSATAALFSCSSLDTKMSLFS
eukprot:SAG31_NODE_1075_length_10048_cov_21.627701_5_plen_79_part_00